MEGLMYEEDDNGISNLLPQATISLLKVFHAYYIYVLNNGEPIKDSDWTKITASEFDNFRVSAEYLASIHGALLQTPTPTSSHASDALHDFC